MFAGLDKEAFQERLKGVFTPARPIASPEHLHGRDQKLRLIDRALSSPGKHIFIYGDRGVGKTSLARTAASLHAGNENGFAFVVCDQATTFSDIVETTCRQLKALRASGKIAASGGTTQLGVTADQSAEPLAMGIRTINDAVEILRSVAPPTGKVPTVIIDEFDQLSSDAEKKFIADLIKQLSDQGINLRLIICGIGSSLDELIGVHLSTDRYLATVPLTPLSHDARWEILLAGSRAFDIEFDRNMVIRIGQLSDGYPYYIHLMGEQIFWEAFDAPEFVKKISLDHYADGLRSAIEEAQTSLRNAYELATQKHKNSKDYEEALWAVADGSLLFRATSEIFEKSYIKIKDEQGSEPIPKEQFYQRLNSLKKPAHGSILYGNRQGWYGFKENIVRGYVRLRAERAGVRIGVDHVKG